MLALAGTDGDPATNEQRAGVDADLSATVGKRPRADPVGLVSGRLHLADAALPGYEAHHNGPQYFGYLRQQRRLLEERPRRQDDARAASATGTLGDQGIFYVKGSSINEFGWKPANPDPYVQANWLGDDDHPGTGDSDAQIGEVVRRDVRQRHRAQQVLERFGDRRRVGRQRRLLGPRAAAELRAVRRRPAVRRRQPHAVLVISPLRTQRCDRARLRRHRLDREVCRDACSACRRSRRCRTKKRSTCRWDRATHSGNHRSERRVRSRAALRHGPADPRERCGDSDNGSTRFRAK